MATVLVTGGTGTLGRHLVPALLASGHDVRVLSRRRRALDGVDARRGDVLTGEGLHEAVAGADVVVHAATSSGRHVRTTEVDGTGNVLAAASAAGARVVYVSIVGVDRHRLSYYRAKLAAERLVEAHAGPWAIQRATQFHELLDRALGLPVLPRTRTMPFQPVAAAEVAAVVAEAVTSGATGRLPDLAGPEVLGMRELAATRRRIRGRAARLVRVPAVGPLADFEAGRHLAGPGARQGRTTWATWLGA